MNTLFLTVPCLFLAVIPALQTPNSSSPKGPSGRIAKLPGESPAGEVLEGRLRLVGRTLDESVRNLQDGNIRAFVQSYREMVQAYGQLSDQIGDASQTLGEVRARIELARAQLDGLKPARVDESAGVVATDVDTVRARLLARLSALRERHNLAKTDEQARLVDQMLVLVRHIEQLDQVRASLDSGASALVPSHAIQDLQDQWRAVAQELEQEQELMVVVSESLAVLVDSASTEMRRSLRFLELESQLPHAELQRLRDTKSGMERLLREVHAAREQAAIAVMQILGGSRKAASPIPAGDVLNRVDSLLGRAQSSNAPSRLQTPASRSGNEE